MALIFLLYALFASVFTAAKIGLSYSEPFFLVGSRMLLAGILLFAYQALKNPQRLRLSRLQWWKVFLLGLFNIYLTNVFEFWGLQYLTSSKTSFIYSLSPFFAALLSYIVFKERMSLQKWLGLTIGFIGFIPLLLNQAPSEQSLAAFTFISSAEGAVMIAAAATVYGWVLMRQLVTNGVTAVTANAYAMVIGGIMALAHSLAVETWQPLPLHGSLTGFAESVIWMTVVSSLICYNLYGYLLKQYSVTLISFSGFSTTFFVAIFSWFALGERPLPSFYVSAAIVFVGLFLFYQEELKQEGSKSTEAAQIT